MRKLNENRDVDNFFEFINFDKRNYYHMGDRYEDGRSLDTFLEDVRDYECGLYLVSFDSGSYDFILGTNRDKEQAVLEDFADMLGESDRYGYSARDVEEDPVSLDSISQLSFDEFVEITEVAFDKEIYDVIEDKIWDIDSAEKAFDKEGFYTDHNFYPRTKKYGVTEFIEWARQLDRHYSHSEFRFLAHDVTDEKVTIIAKVTDRDVCIYEIEAPHGQYFSRHVPKLIWDYIDNERNK